MIQTVLYSVRPSTGSGFRNNRMAAIASTTPGSAYGISVTRVSRRKRRERRQTRKYASGTATRTMAMAAVADRLKLLTNARFAAGWSNSTQSDFHHGAGFT